MTELELRLKPPPRPVAGYLAVASGLAGIVTYAIVFVPLALVLGVVALFRGQPGWGIAGLGLAVVGTLTSPTLLALLGLAAIAAWLG